MNAQLSGIDHRGVGAKDRKQLPAKEQQNRCEDRIGRIAFDKADLEGTQAAIVTARAIVLAHKRGTCLAKGVEAIPREGVDIVCGGVARHDSGIQAVHGRLDDDIRHGEQRTLNTCGQADDKNALERGPVDCQLAQIYTNDGIAVRQAP